MQVKKQQLELYMEQLTGKGVWKGCILPPCLFNLYTEYIMWNDRSGESQAAINTAGRNINNLGYEDDTTLTEESEKVLKNLLMRVDEESEKAGLKLNIQKKKKKKKTETMASSSITSWQIEEEKVKAVTGLYFLVLQNLWGW